MKICLIAAVAENGVIGNGHDLPWRIKSEWQYFVRMTKNKPVILGRKTFESIGSPLKNRTNIIITRDNNYSAEGITVVHSLEQALALAGEVAAATGQDEIMVAGGAEIYKQALPLADILYLTEVHLKPEGKIKFPEFDAALWQETKNEFHAAQEGESADYTIKVLERKN